jgi:hypothetical protein
MAQANLAWLRASITSLIFSGIGELFTTFGGNNTLAVANNGGGMAAGAGAAANAGMDSALRGVNLAGLAGAAASAGYGIRQVTDESDVRGFWRSGGRFLGPVMGFNSMHVFEKVFGKAPLDMVYHHNVMQFRDNITKFGPWFIHNTRNIMLIPRDIHDRITWLQNTVRPYSDGLVYHQWVRQFDYSRQYREGIKLYQQAVTDMSGM